MEGGRRKGERKKRGTPDPPEPPPSPRKDDDGEPFDPFVTEPHCAVWPAWLDLGTANHLHESLVHAMHETDVGTAEIVFTIDDETATHWSEPLLKHGLWLPSDPSHSYSIRYGVEPSTGKVLREVVDVHLLVAEFRQEGSSIEGEEPPADFLRYKGPAAVHPIRSAIVDNVSTIVVRSGVQDFDASRLFFNIRQMTQSTTYEHGQVSMQFDSTIVGAPEVTAAVDIVLGRIARSGSNVTNMSNILEVKQAPVAKVDVHIRSLSHGTSLVAGIELNAGTQRWVHVK